MSKFIFVHLLFGGIFLSAGLFAAESNAPASLKRYTYETPQMGVPFRIIIYSDQGVCFADHAADLTWNRIAKLNHILSNYETDSELSKLGYASGLGEWATVSHELWHILAQSQKLSVQSDGAFDLTLGPATALWRKARRQLKMPSPDALKQMWQRTGWNHLLLRPENQSAYLTVPGMRLDPGGIAKGFALDEGLKVLKEAGIQHALISGGGDMAFYGGKPDGQGWQVRLAGFEENQEDGPMLELKDGAVATSGDLFQFVDIEGIRYSHILDPQTGLGLTVRTLTTVIASEGIQADSLATTLSVLGPEKAANWAKEHAMECSIRILWLDHHQQTHEWTQSSSILSF